MATNLQLYICACQDFSHTHKQIAKKLAALPAKPSYTHINLVNIVVGK